MEGESVVTVPLFFLPSLKANSYPSQRNRVTSRMKSEGECLVSATQWGIPSKAWNFVGRSCGSGLPSRERERSRGEFKCNPREQGEHSCRRARNLIGRYLNAPVTRDICAAIGQYSIIDEKKFSNEEGKGEDLITSLESASSR